MKGYRLSEKQTISILTSQQSRVATADVCRPHGTSPATFYKWKAKYGGLDLSDAPLSRAKCIRQCQKHY